MEVIPAGAQVACYQVFGFKEVRGHQIAEAPKPPEKMNELVRATLADVSAPTRETGLRKWHEVAGKVTALSESFASFQGRFRSSFYGHEMPPEVDSVLNKWSSWKDPRFVVFDNQYRLLNPNHENYLRTHEAEGLNGERQSTRVFPSEEPVIVQLTSEGMKVLHNGTSADIPRLLPLLEREVPKELPRGMVAVFRGRSLLESSESQPVPFVLMKPIEYGTFRELEMNEVVQLVLTPPEGQKYSPIPQGAVIVQRPQSIPEGARVEYGVRLNFSSLRYRNRPVVPFIGYVIVKDGKLLEVGAGSRALVKELGTLLSPGRMISDQQKTDIAELTTELLKEIEESPTSRAAMKGFRNWPEGLIEKSGVVHFDPKSFDLEAWVQSYAQKKSWSEEKLFETLVLSGWAEVRYNRFGRKSYRLLNEEGDLVPFFQDSDRKSVSYFRMRRSNPAPKSSKYREFPEFYDTANSPREDDMFFSPRIHKTDSVFASFLKKVSGEKKRLVVTEGEFKSLVAEWFGRWPVVALSGIHSYNNKSVRELIRSAKEMGTEEIVVIFDGDPRGKGMARADGLSDSKRQAYAFGRELQEAIHAEGLSGKLQVKIGLLPKSEKPGAKDAIDDAIMENPVEGLKAYEQAVLGSQTLREYARNIGLDQILVELFTIQRALDIALKEPRAALETGFQFRSEDQAKISEAERIYKDVSEAMKSHLNQYYNLDSLHTAEKTITRIPPAGTRDQYKPEAQVLVQKDGETLDVTRFFRHEFVVAPAVFKSTSSEGKCQTAACLRLPYSELDLSELFRTGVSKNKTLSEDYTQGVRLAEIQGHQLQQPEDLRAAVLAGYLSNRIYPGEIIEFAPVLRGSSEAQLKSSVLVRRNSSGNAIGVFFSQTYEVDSQVMALWRALRPGVAPVR